jgi:hypothetical protein
MHHGCAEMCLRSGHFVLGRLPSAQSLPSVLAIAATLSQPHGPPVEKYADAICVPSRGNGSAKNTIDFESALRQLLAAELAMSALEPSPRRSLQSKFGLAVRI